MREERHLLYDWNWERDSVVVDGHRSFLGSSRSSDRVGVELRVFQSVCILYIEGAYSVCILYIEYISEFAHMIIEAVRSPEL